MPTRHTPHASPFSFTCSTSFPHTVEQYTQVRESWQQHGAKTPAAATPAPPPPGHILHSVTERRGGYSRALARPVDQLVHLADDILRLARGRHGGDLVGDLRGLGRGRRRVWIKLMPLGEPKGPPGGDGVTSVQPTAPCSCPRLRRPLMHQVQHRSTGFNTEGRPGRV